MTDSGWRKRQIALDAKAENARELGLDYDIHSCSHLCTKPMCVAEAIAEANRRANASWTLMCEKMVAMEREVCAKVVDHILREGGGTWGDAIRARGETK
jgi:hypothetical protein